MRLKLPPIIIRRKMNEKKILNNQDCRTVNSGQFEAVVSLRPELLNKIHYGDSFEFLEGCPPNVFDLILEDMPYNTTACDWDVKIDLELYWKTRLRTLKPTGLLVLTAAQPFTSDLVYSNKNMFKYEIIWDKKCISNPMLAKIRPLAQHENILIFSAGKTTFNPILHKKNTLGTFSKTEPHTSDNYGKTKLIQSDNNNENGYPRSIIDIRRPINLDNDSGLHPTQKPVGLFEYLIRTYTNEGDLVFDGFGGSGTTAIAAYRANRNFIVVEKEQKYFELSEKRLAVEQQQCRLFEASN